MRLDGLQLYLSLNLSNWRQSYRLDLHHTDYLIVVPVSSQDAPCLSPSTPGPSAGASPHSPSPSTNSSSASASSGSKERLERMAAERTARIARLKEQKQMEKRLQVGITGFHTGFFCRGGVGGDFLEGIENRFLGDLRVLRKWNQHTHEHNTPQIRVSLLSC